MLAASVALTTVAVVAPPTESRDVWSYAFYGRVALEYRDSPYTTAPDDHPEDPYYERIGPRWRDSPSMYGPAFVGVSVVVMAVAGTHADVARVLFQLLAAAAVLAALVLVAHATRSAAAVAALGLNPLIAYSVVNSGHNDAIIGLCVLAAVLLAMRDRDVAAALVLAVAALVKLPVIVALPAFALWIWYRRGVHRAAVAGAAGVAVVLGGLFAAGGVDVVDALSDARDRLSWASIWQMLRPGAWDGFFTLAQRTAEPLPSATATAAAGATVVLAGWLVYTRRRDSTPILVIGAALAAYLLAAAYVLPWYAAWVLPVLALRWRSGLSVLVAVLAAWWSVAYQYERSLTASDVNHVLWLLAVVTITGNLVAMVGLAVAGWRRERDARRGTTRGRTTAGELTP